MKDFIDFFSFSDPNVRYVVLGSVLLAVSSAIVGSFTFLKKKSLVGDAVAHSVLPGVCLAFMLTGTKNPFILIVGAFCTGWISLVIMDQIVAKSKLKQDTAIGLVLSVFFGIGILLLTVIQSSGNAAQSGLDSFLFGKAAALVGEDLIAFGSVSIILLAVVYLLFKEFTLISFDENFAVAIGFPVRRLELVLTTLTVLAVVVGIQAVGVVLMAAMLITPAAAARFWTDNLKKMVLLSALFGAFSGIAGAFVSYTAPSMPTGPWIVMIISIIALFSFFFAPRRGIVLRLLRNYRNQQQILTENILKELFKMAEAGNKIEYSIEELLQFRSFDPSKLKPALSKLSRQGYVEKIDEKWKLTVEGQQKGQRVVKLHRLWELYLTEYLRIAPDHVHEDAETIEHVITPELEVRLEKLLDKPELDPHQSKIPY
ncbi:MAG: iron chelate uptake ABC transporter family permease subunit [Cyclobacteriaceae bacterium]